MPWLRVLSAVLLSSVSLAALAQPSGGGSSLGTPAQTLQPPRAPGQAAPPAPVMPATRAPSAPPGAPPGQLTVPPRLQGQPARPPAAATAPRTATPQARPGTPPVVRPPQPNARTAPANRTRPAAAAGAATAATAAAAAAAAAAPVQPPPEPLPDVGAVTGLPTPRFVALRADEVNLRVGPDTRFPIEWTYQRRDLPVEVVREYNQWRRIRDIDGTEGWVHQSTLAGRRTMLVRGQQRELRRSESADSNVVAHLQPGVVGRIRKCAAASAWCEVQVGDLRGWLRRSEMWGVKPDEEIN
jgi:SH3-like domain-containing protein